jgi:hypothetical protein
MNAKDLLNEVQSSIEKALPAIQVDVFRKYVDDSEKYKRDYETLKFQHDDLVKRYDACVKERDALRQLKLDNEEVTLTAKQLLWDKKVFEVEQKLKDASIQSAQEKVKLMNDLVYAIFRNTEVRKQTLGSIPVIQENNYNGQVSRYNTTAAADLNETKREE